jgi:hypothetical protein
MRTKCIFSSFFVWLLITSMISGCKSDNDNDTNTPENGIYDVTIHVTLTDPDPSSFDITGVVAVAIDGQNVTFTGSYKIGLQVYPDIVFHGTLNGDQLTMITDSCRVQLSDPGSVTYEDISWHLPVFTVSYSSASGSGQITATRRPEEYIESGTFTFQAFRRE